jgi:murein DD-endopeptidase MepM/ murein hydrolase activator NlpD
MLRKQIILFLTFTLFTTNLINPIKTIAAENSIDSLNQQLAEATANVNDISKKKSGIKEEAARVEVEIKKIETIVEQTEKEVINLDTQVKANTIVVDKLTKQTRETLKQIQISSNVNPVENILGSKNLGEFLSEVYTVSTRHTKLRDDLKALEEATKKLENDRLAKQKITEDSKVTKNILIVTKMQQDDLLKNYEGRESEYAQKIEDLKADKVELEKIAAETRKNALNIGRGGQCWYEDTNNPGMPAGYFQNPAPSGVLSDVFGCPTAYSSLWRDRHDGIDIATFTNAPILAAATGVVHSKGSYNISGFGNWVMLKHTLPNGNRVYSLYAHMSQPSNAVVGNTVSSGTEIGKAGCTGSCTGTHLHFMLYTQSFETSGHGCAYGSSKCYDPSRFLSL